MKKEDEGFYGKEMATIVKFLIIPLGIKYESLSAPTQAKLVIAFGQAFEEIYDAGYAMGRKDSLDQNVTH